MPKRSKRPKTKKKTPPQKPRKSSIGWGGVVAAIALVALAGGLGYSWWQASSGEREFQDLVARGRGMRPKIRSIPSAGNAHLRAGESHRYSTRFPTSGPHDPDATRPGFYDRPQPPSQIIHALEHGNVVIYYEKPGREALRALRSWSSIFRGRFDGIIVTPVSGLGESVVLTAWTKLLELRKFDPAAAAMFIDTYRGRGPENPVR